MRIDFLTRCLVGSSSQFHTEDTAITLLALGSRENTKHEQTFHEMHAVWCKAGLSRA
jgi:hypothetical protein